MHHFESVYVFEYAKTCCLAGIAVLQRVAVHSNPNNLIVGDRGDQKIIDKIRDCVESDVLTKVRDALEPRLNLSVIVQILVNREYTESMHLTCSGDTPSRALMLIT